MVDILIDFMLEIPQALANMGNWLISPINDKWIPISPIALLGIAGTSTIIALIVIHVVKLFI